MEQGEVESVSYPYPLHLQEDGSLEGFLPRGQVAGQLHLEGVALAVAHQDAKAQGFIVLLLGRVLQAEVESRLQPAVFRHPELQETTTVLIRAACSKVAFGSFSLVVLTKFLIFAFHV